MARPDIPQDIIDKTIGMIDTKEKSLLKICAQVSDSFVYPSIKRYFAAIALSTPEDCENLLYVLTAHPPDLDIPSYIKTLQILYPRALVPRANYRSDHQPQQIDSDAFKFPVDLVPVLHLLSHSQALERLEFHVGSGCSLLSQDAHDWHKFPGGLRAALSDMICSPYLTSLTIANTNVPPELFVGLKGVRTLCLDQVELSDVGNNSLPTAKTQTPSDDHHVDRASIERFTWCLPTSAFPEPRNVVAWLPFLTHPRFIEFNASKTEGLDWLSSFLRALRSSLRSPATLEDLKLCCAVSHHSMDTILTDGNASDVWADLDSLVADPLYARLRRVGVVVEVFGNEVDIDNINARVYGALPQLLPLLYSKGILHIQVEENY